MRAGFVLAVLLLAGVPAAQASSVFRLPVADSPSDNPLTGDENRAFVQAVQKMLANGGYLQPGEADGQLGARTFEALKHFQKDHGLQDDGHLTPEVFELLASQDRRKH